MNKKKSDMDQLANSCIIFFKVICSLISFGTKKFHSINLKGIFWINFILGLAVLYKAIGLKLHLSFLKFLFPHIFTKKVLLLMANIDPNKLFLFLSILLIIGVIIILGIPEYKRTKKLQKAVEIVGLKNSMGHVPKIVRIHDEGKTKTKLHFLSEGIGLYQYQKKKSDLETSFNQRIESIHHSDQPKFIEIQLNKDKLPSQVRFDKIKRENEEKISPYSFIVGHGINGLITQEITQLPHMLIAGSTGTGKSVFFKQALMCLLESSSHLQLYLIDLKGGVEMSSFKDCPNVTVVKTIEESVLLLKWVEREMKGRFSYLEMNEYQEILPERDKKDVIVVGVDEASVLYMKGHQVQGTNKLLMSQAKETTDQIAKLGRAAKISLILATQKVSKETIDTHIQENVSGRFALKANTLQGSLTVLGNGQALDLPDIPGRGIWSTGHKFIEVQAPYIDSETIKKRCGLVLQEFENGTKKLFQEQFRIKISSKLEKQGLLLNVHET